MMHLKEFLNQPLIHKIFVNRSYVDFDGFDSLYVRNGWYSVNYEIIQETIQLANLTASNPGNGAFKNLVAYLQENFSGIPIIVECVHTEKFATGLLKMGFKQFNINQGNHFILRSRFLIGETKL